MNSLKSWGYWRSSLALFFLFSYASILLAAADWPQWRGPDGQGHGHGSGFPDSWSPTEHVTWKTPLPGRGWSSPVISGDQIWVTTALETEATPEELERRLKNNTGNEPLTVLDRVSLRALCLNRDSGTIVHDVELFSVNDPQWVHKLNSYASPTPVIEKGKLYAHFGTFGTACVDTHSGETLWTNQELPTMHENGPGSSPVLWGDLVIFHLDGSDTQSVAALHAETGLLAWRTYRSGKMNDNNQLKKSYGTPLVLEVEGEPQLVSPGSDWLYGYEPATGRELWRLNYETLGFSISSRPVAGHGMIYMSTGFMRPHILAIRIQNGQPEIVWRYIKGAPKVPSPVLVGDYLYFVTDAGGILTCLDAKTGQELYRERLNGNFNSSPIHADGKIMFASREGVTHLIQPGPEFKILNQNELPGRIMASPAAVDGAYYFRTEEAMYRIE